MTQAIQSELFTHNLDICALTETWIKSGGNLTPTHICPPGYNSMPEPRQDKMGGGIAIVYKEALKITKQEAPKYQTVELAEFKIKPCTSLPATTLTIIYRPPDSNVLSFLHELSDYLERTIIENGKVILLRDFNIHINRADNMDAINFVYFLDSFGLINRVDFPTHRLVNTLDLIITSEDDFLIPCMSQGHLFSDHHMVIFNLSLPKKELKKKTITYRKLKNIDYSTFAAKINEKMDGIKDSNGSLD